MGLPVAFLSEATATSIALEGLGVEMDPYVRDCVAQSREVLLANEAGQSLTESARLFIQNKAF